MTKYNYKSVPYSEFKKVLENYNIVIRSKADEETLFSDLIVPRCYLSKRTDNGVLLAKTIKCASNINLTSKIFSDKFIIYYYSFVNYEYNTKGLGLFKKHLKYLAKQKIKANLKLKQMKIKHKLKEINEDFK